LARIESLYKGIENLEKIPDIIFIIDIKNENTALKEAIRMSIPVIALVDTNSDIEDINYPVPSNDDAIKAIALMTHIFAEGINEGKSQPLEETGSNSNQTQEKRVNE